MSLTAWACGDDVLTLYLDTSDLSYLVKNRGPRDAADFANARARLIALLRSDRVRLIVSVVHLAEMAIDEETARAALSWLDDGPPVWCFTTPVESIFRGELRGERVDLQGEAITRARLDALRIPLRYGATSLSGSLVARLLKAVTKGWARAENISKRGRLRRAGTTARAHAAAMAEQRRRVDQMLQGDLDSLPVPARWLARRFLPLAGKALGVYGLTLADVHAQQRLPIGYSWFAGLLPPGEWQAAVKRVRTPRDAPASALRVAVEKWEQGDAGRKARSGTVYDVRHLAYAAQCDIATIDSANLRATAKVREAFRRPQFFGTGKIASVVRAIETLVGAPSER